MDGSARSECSRVRYDPLYYKKQDVKRKQRTTTNGPLFINNIVKLYKLKCDLRTLRTHTTPIQRIMLHRVPRVTCSPVLQRDETEIEKSGRGEVGFRP